MLLNFGSSPFTGECRSRIFCSSKPLLGKRTCSRVEFSCAGSWRVSRKWNHTDGDELGNSVGIVLGSMLGKVLGVSLGMVVGELVGFFDGKVVGDALR